MNIQHEEIGNHGTFFVEQNGERVAYMTYSKAGTTRIIIDHTEVSEALKGQNVGRQLVAASVDYARKKNLKILPLCPFAHSVFDRVKEYADVLD
ncbi:MAG: N-acetyltransferase [Cyclobacteriaceae bacterium]|nr:N-acetyltransferase [Cyclobacteriaceae bacterium]